MVKTDHAVLVVELPLSPRDAQRYGVDELRRRGWRVSVVDVGDLTQPDVPQNRDHYQGMADGDLHVVRERHQLRPLAPVLADADFIIAQFGSFGCSLANLAVYRALSRSGRPMVKLFVNAYPGWSSADRPKPGLTKRLAGLARMDPFSSLVARLPLSWLGVRPVARAVFGGRRSLIRNQVVTETTRPIFAHSLDYEICLPLLADPPPRDGTAVFIDENVGHQIDALALGVQYDFSLDHYLACLRGAFDRIEAELGLKVVVAGNPRADYADRIAGYGHRPIVQGRTADLIAAADLVLGHRSTALGMAVILDKPVLQLAIDGHYRHWVNRQPYDGYARALGKPIAFVDTPGWRLDQAMAIDRAAYAGYLEDYVKAAQSPRRPFWDIVLAGLADTHVNDRV